MRRCLECGKVAGSDKTYMRRGLCRKCYRSYVGADYRTLPRGAWHPTAQVWDGYSTVRLLELFKRGLSDKDIAEELGRSVGSVCKRRQRLGLRVSPARQATHRRRGTGNAVSG